MFRHFSRSSFADSDNKLSGTCEIRLTKSCRNLIGLDDCGAVGQARFNLPLTNKLHNL